MKKTFPASQLIINEDGSIFHLHIRPEHLADKVILVGDQGRVNMVASFFDEGSIESATFKAASFIPLRANITASASLVSPQVSAPTTAILC